MPLPNHRIPINATVSIGVPNLLSGLPGPGVHAINAYVYQDSNFTLNHTYVTNTTAPGSGETTTTTITNTSYAAPIALAHNSTQVTIFDPAGVGISLRVDRGGLVEVREQGTGILNASLSMQYSDDSTGDSRSAWDPLLTLQLQTSLDQITLSLPPPIIFSLSSPVESNSSLALIAGDGQKDGFLRLVAPYSKCQTILQHTIIHGITNITSNINSTVDVFIGYADQGHGDNANNSSAVHVLPGALKVELRHTGTHCPRNACFRAS